MVWRSRNVLPDPEPPVPVQPPVSAGGLAWSRRFPALGHRPFRWFLAASTVSVVGSFMTQAGLAWHVQTLTGRSGSVYWLGVADALATLPMLLLAIPSGAAADRLDRGGLLVMTQWFGLGLSGGFGLLLILGGAPLGLTLTFAVLGGVIQTFYFPVRQSLLAELVGPADMSSAVTLNAVSFNLGRLLGPAAAGLVITGAGTAACFLLDAASYLGLIAVLHGLGRARGLKRRPSGGSGGAFRAVFGDPTQRCLMLYFMAVLGVAAPYAALLPALAEDVLGGGVGGYSLLMSAN